MRTIRRLVIAAFLFLGLASLLAADVAPPADADTIERLVKQLGSDNFKERKEASKALYKIGAPALAALRRAQATSKDGETQRRAVELINAIEARLTPDAFVPTKVWLKANKTPLSEVLHSLSKQSGIALFLAREPVDLARRPITLDTGTISFWEALDALCKEAKIHIRPEIQDVSPAKAPAGPAGLPMGFFIEDTPSPGYQLVLQDGLLPDTAVCYLGSVRLRLVFTSRDQGEIRGYVEVLSEPRMEWSGDLALRWSEAKDDQGKVLAVLPLTKESKPVAANGGRRVGRAFAEGLGRRVIRRQEIPLLWNVPGKDVHSVSELRGEFSGKTELLAVKVITVDNLLTVEPKPLSGKGGYQLTVEDCQRNNNDGSVTLRLTVTPPPQKNAPAGGAIRQVIRRAIQIQGNVPLPVPGGGGMVILGNDDDGMFQFNVKDTNGRPYTVAVTSFEAETNNKGTVHKYTLHLQPAAKDAIPAKLELLAPLEVTVKSACTFRNLRLP